MPQRNSSYIQKNSDTFCGLLCFLMLEKIFCLITNKIILSFLHWIFAIIDNFLC